MKLKLCSLLSLLLIINFKVLAQDTWENDSLWVVERQAIVDEINTIFVNLDKNKLTTGFLYDRVPLPVSGIEKYNGLTDSIIDTERWLQLYYELTQYASSTPDQYMSVFILDSIIKSTNTIPLGIISLEYDKIRDDAIDNGSLYIQNNQLFENTNTGTSPYARKLVFAAIPLKNSFEPTVTFKLDNRFYLSNNNLQQIEIDFGDGAGIRNLKPGDEVTVNYAGKTNVQFKAKTTIANQSIQSISSCIVNQPVTQIAKTAAIKGVCNYLDAPDDKWDIETKEKYADLESGITQVDPPIDGVWARGRAYVKYGCGNTFIDKPLIFVEGVDFGDKNLEFRYGDFGWVPQISEGKDPDDDKGNPPDPISMLKIAKLPDLVTALCNEGYDLIMLDFEDGAYYMQRNAMVLVELIKRVNDSLKVNNSPHKNVVLGASMGGQVSRFALRYMERNWLDHNTGTWIAFDSPNEGANIPLGIQFGIYRAAMYQTNVLLEFAPQLLRPASKQLLLYHFLSSSNKIAKEHELRTKLYSLDDNMLGYPTIPYKVAIVNGNGYGNNQGYSSGSEIVNISNDLKEILVNAVPNKTEKSIFQATLKFNVLGKTISTIVDNRIFNNTLPVDNCPGGSRTTAYTYSNSLFFVEENDVKNLQTYHSFIPTYSALGLNSAYIESNISSVFGSGYPVYNTNKSLSPFDVLYAPNTNEEHVQITNQNIQWLLEAIAPDCRGDLTAAYSYSSDPCASSLLLNGSGSQNETQHQWRIKDGSSYFYIPGVNEFFETTVDKIDLSEYYSFNEKQTYEVSLIVRNNCCKEDVFTKNIKARFQGYKNIDEEITFENTIIFNCDLTINNGGILNIKKEMALGDGVKLTIEPGGKLNLIDGAILIFSNNTTISGDLTLKNKNYVGISQSAYVSYINGTLTVEDGAIIELKYGSTLVFEENSNLYYQNITKDKGIILKEPSSELFLNQCAVITPDNVDFTFQGSGYVRINSFWQGAPPYDPADPANPGNISLDPKQISPIFQLGNNSKINISGYYSGQNTHKAIVIENALALLNDEMLLQDVTMEINGTFYTQQPYEI